MYGDKSPFEYIAIQSRRRQPHTLKRGPIALANTTAANAQTDAHSISDRTPSVRAPTESTRSEGNAQTMPAQVPLKRPIGHEASLEDNEDKGVRPAKKTSKGPEATTAVGNSNRQVFHMPYSSTLSRK